MLREIPMRCRLLFLHARRIWYVPRSSRALPHCPLLLALCLTAHSYLGLHKMLECEVCCFELNCHKEGNDTVGCVPEAPKVTGFLLAAIRCRWSEGELQHRSPLLWMRSRRHGQALSDAVWSMLLPRVVHQTRVLRAILQGTLAYSQHSHVQPTVLLLCSRLRLLALAVVRVSVLLNPLGCSPWK